MARPAPTPPARDDDHLIGWDDGETDAESRPAAPREDIPPRARKVKGEPAPVVPPLQEKEALGLGGKEPAARAPSTPQPDLDDDVEEVLPAPDGAEPAGRGDVKAQRASRGHRDIGGLIYLIALALLAAALSATVVLVLF